VGGVTAMRRTAESIEEGYKEPRCARLRDHPDFNAIGDLEECDCVINKKTGERCGAPRYCHFSGPSALCRLTQHIINSNKDEYITTNNLCIACLQKKVCCLAACHPPGATPLPHQIGRKMILEVLTSTTFSYSGSGS
jgi:hypothetical protein